MSDRAARPYRSTRGVFRQAQGRLFDSRRRKPATPPLGMPPREMFDYYPTLGGIPRCGVYNQRRGEAHLAIAACGVCGRVTDWDAGPAGADLFHARGKSGLVLRLFGCFLFGREHAAHNRPVYLVGSFHDLPSVILLANGEGRQVAFLAEILMPNPHRQVAFQIVLAIGRFITMLSAIASEDADLVVVPRQAVFGLVQQDEVLRLRLAIFLDGVEDEISDDALAFGVLRNVERDVEIDHAQQHPAHMPRRAAD